jgi:GDPmannose 4,6-dehydratase
MNKKITLITGINGQDGSYLAEFLLSKNYEVHGTLKRNSVSENQTSRLENIYNDIILHYADLSDFSSLVSVIQKVMPDEIYNLAAQSHVRISFDQPIYTANVTGIGTLNLLEAVKLIKPDTKIYQASSSEMFGNSIDQDGYQRETTPMNPVSPYGCAKVFSYNICRNYRNSYGMKIWNGILFNHESPRRGTNFVTNKVVKEAVKIKLGLSNELKLGNLDATRDWGHAKDYVEVMWLMLQDDKPDDYVCATGISHSVRDLCDYTFSKLGLDYNQYVKQDQKHLKL